VSVPPFWVVLKGGLPRHLRFAAVVLAMIAEDEGDGIYIGTDTLAEYLGLQHRQTAGKLLAELEALGVLETVKRGGRWRGSSAKVTARHSSRRLNVAALEAAFGRNRTVASSADHATGLLRDVPDHATAQLREHTHLATARLPIQTVELLQTVQPATDRNNTTECLTQMRSGSRAARVPARRRRIKVARPVRTRMRCSHCQRERLAVDHRGHEVRGEYVCPGCFSDPAVRRALGIEASQQQEEQMEVKS
jgi:hypothetical protein